MRRIALYSHDAQGLGHLRRNLAIAGVVGELEPAAVLLVAGTREAGLFPLPPGTDILTLPALRKAPEGGYRSRSLDVCLEDMVALRVGILRSALAAFRPDVLIVDKLPGGVEDELLESFEELHEIGTKIVLGLREVLDEPERVALDWARSSFVEVVRAHFDAIWVYGDPRVFDPVAEYGMPEDLARMVRYTGYVDRTRGIRPTAAELQADREQLGLPDGPLCVCMAGGGEDGAELLGAFAQAEMPDGTTGVIVTGPLMPDDQRQRLVELAGDRDDLVLLPFAQDADRLIHLAEQVVSMGGYNTSCEILASGTRALIVPRVHPRREQIIRAQRLAELGAVDVLHPRDLDPAAISAWLQAGPQPPDEVHPPIDLGALRRLPFMLDDLLRRSATVTTTAREIGLALA